MPRRVCLFYFQKYAYAQWTWLLSFPLLFSRVAAAERGAACGVLFVVRRRARSRGGKFVPRLLVGKETGGWGGEGEVFVNVPHEGSVRFQVVLLKEETDWLRLCLLVVDEIIVPYFVCLHRKPLFSLSLSLAAGF